MFLFFSLAYGILASFEYGVLSGDSRDSDALMITWIFPSLSFASSIITLFAGFVFVAASYSTHGVSIDFPIQNLMRFAATIVSFAVLFFITRTITESIPLVSAETASNYDRDPSGIIVLIGAIAFIAVQLIDNFNRLSAHLKNHIRYFYFLVMVLVYCIAGYAYTSVLSSVSSNVPSWPLYVTLVVTWILVLWTVYLLPKLSSS